ncbi:hypothetical protein H0X06_03305 [Candidatus Dependentiae bacterium]|nr:hypothetical protein [Candidatus Dependentiae bacterium]
MNYIQKLVFLTVLSLESYHIQCMDKYKIAEKTLSFDSFKPSKTIKYPFKKDGSGRFIHPQQKLIYTMTQKKFFLKELPDDTDLRFSRVGFSSDNKRFFLQYVDSQGQNVDYTWDTELIEDDTLQDTLYTEPEEDDKDIKKLNTPPSLISTPCKGGGFSFILTKINHLF